MGLWESGNGLGPMHRSTEPVEMLSHIQKLYKIKHVVVSQRSSIPVHWTQAFPWESNLEETATVTSL